jgi:hypothetical protein
LGPDIEVTVGYIVIKKKMSEDPRKNGALQKY